VRKLFDKQLWLFIGIIVLSSLFSVEFRDYRRTKKLMDEITAKIHAMPNKQGEIGEVKNTLAIVRTLSMPRTRFFHGAFNYSDDYLEAFFSGSGACGMYTLFTCRILHHMGYSCRVVQQQVNHVWGGHITLEVDLNRFNSNQPERWMLIDPLFNWVFLDSHKHELPAQKVKKMWPQLIQQLPAEYDKKYNYQEGYRYTNWDKFGAITRTAYKVGKVMDLPMDTFSFRGVFIRQHYWKLVIYFLGLCLTVFFALRTWIKK